MLLSLNSMGFLNLDVMYIIVNYGLFVGIIDLRVNGWNAYLLYSCIFWYNLGTKLQQ